MGCIPSVIMTTYILHNISNGSIVRMFGTIWMLVCKTEKMVAKVAPLLTHIHSPNWHPAPDCEEYLCWMYTLQCPTLPALVDDETPSHSLDMYHLRLASPALFKMLHTKKYVKILVFLSPHHIFINIKPVCSKRPLLSTLGDSLKDINPVKYFHSVQTDTPARPATLSMTALTKNQRLNSKVISFYCCFG